MTSLNTEVNRDSIFKAKESAGKSGSFFFFSFDRKFLIKTMNDGELTIFLKALPTYLLHLRENKNSLIARIYGIYTVQMEDIAPVHLFLMSNCA
jgi:1-phosphatidylinositol-4-phosphate 5-kinase